MTFLVLGLIPIKSRMAGVQLNMQTITVLDRLYFFLEYDAPMKIQKPVDLTLIENSSCCHIKGGKARQKMTALYFFIYIFFIYYISCAC